MFCLRLLQAATQLRTKHALARGTATYSYRMYGDADGPNYHILQHLTKEMQREQVSGANHFKMRAFATAMKAIHELDYPITQSTRVTDIPGIGEGISRRIMEFIGANRKKNHCLKPVDIKEQKKRWAMQELQRINGIGPIKARSLVESGCTSLKQLHEERFFKMLSRSIQASLQYQQEIGARVTRQQAEAFMASIHEFISAEFKLHLVGSYRRGHPTSSDIDVLLFHSSYTVFPTFTTVGDANSSLSHRSSDTHAYPPSTLLYDSVIHPLTQRGIIVSALSGGPSRWQGLVKIHCGEEEAIRRADLYLMPQPSEAAAFLAFTGDTYFNLDCRKRAKRRGMHLNEFGLWRPKLDDRMLKHSGVNEADLDNIDGQGSNPATLQEYQTQWELVETPDEAALLQELDMGYIVPERRNLANLNTREKIKRGESTQLRCSKRDEPPPPQLAHNHASPDSNSPPRRDQTSQLQTRPSHPLQRSQKHGTHGHVW